MIIIPEQEVNLDTTINNTIRSGELGVIHHDDGVYELVYFTHCHYLGSNGGISNTFEYRSFSKNSILKRSKKSYMYKPIFSLHEPSRYNIEIRLIK